MNTATVINRDSMPHDYYVPNGIGYNFEINSRGADFTVYAKGHTPEQITEAKEYLRDNQDVTSITIASESDYVGLYRSFVFRHPETRELKWYQIDDTKISEYYNTGKSINEYVNEVVLTSNFINRQFDPLYK